MSIIVINKLFKSYKGTHALKGLDLTIPKGKIFGLLGPNGAGKTTLMSILNTIIRADSGSINIDGHELTTNPKAVRTISALVPQGNAFYPDLTVYENLQYFGVLFGLTKNTLKERLEQCVESACVSTFLHKKSGICVG